ncbi:unnamed protein product [Symbiodinium natans]|uniref:Uncharacterized protein n=1 Tax=Symbiodinium natans TaxID=878477 RepID=A0A812RHW0_9DINO|nr:unnamed protein product [Symbiodinium natans]
MAPEGIPKDLPGAQIKIARIRYLQQIGFESIDFSNFLQVMRKNGSELGDGTELLQLGVDPELLSPLQTPSDGGAFMSLACPCFQIFKNSIFVLRAVPVKSFVKTSSPDAKKRSLVNRCPYRGLSRL